VRVKFLILKDVRNLLITKFPYLHWPYHWRDLMTMVDGCKQKVKIITIKWEKPDINSYKLNTDGSAMTNPGKIYGEEFLGTALVTLSMHLSFLWAVKQITRQKSLQQYMD